MRDAVLRVRSLTKEGMVNGWTDGLSLARSSRRQRAGANGERHLFGAWKREQRSREWDVKCKEIGYDEMRCGRVVDDRVTVGRTVQPNSATRLSVFAGDNYRHRCGVSESETNESEYEVSSKVTSSGLKGTTETR